MKVGIVRGGGVGGFATRTELDSGALSGDESRTLERMVERALAAPEAPASGDRHPDEMLYAFVVDDGEAERTVRFSEQTLPEPVRELLAWIDSRPEREDRIEPAGGSARGVP